MPLYNTATAATALGVPPKWLDNLLSHNDVDGVSGGRQGVARRLSTDAIRTIALARELVAAIGITTPVALRLAGEILASVPDDARSAVASHSFSDVVSIQCNLDALAGDVAEGLAHAVEVTPHPVRGRPRVAR